VAEYKERNKMKKLIIGVVVFALLVFSSCKAKNVTSTTGTAPPSVQELQTQINDLSSLVNAYSNVISGMQSKLDALETQVTATISTLSMIPPESEPDSSVIDDMNANIEKLTAQVHILQEDVLTLQDNLKGNATNIGTNSISVNGLDVTFVVNGIDVGITGSATPGTAQFAIKITNLTNSIVSNLDVTGTITSLETISSNMAAGYPQIIDAAALCTMSYSNTGANTVNFEAYGNKGSLSIPVGGSITIRPKISILAAGTYKLPATSFLIAIKAITYDGGTPK